MGRIIFTSRLVLIALNYVEKSIVFHNIFSSIFIHKYTNIISKGIVYSVV